MTQNKFNWGTGIYAAIIIFIMMVGVMIFIASKQDRTLVTENYYQLEKQHASRLQKMENFNALGVQITVQQNPDSLSIVFPSVVVANSISGELYFYRASDATLDFRIPIVLNSNGTISISLSSFSKGNYTIISEFTSMGVDYYSEQALTIY